MITKKQLQILAEAAAIVQGKNLCSTLEMLNVLYKNASFERKAELAHMSELQLIVAYYQLHPEKMVFENMYNNWVNPKYTFFSFWCRNAQRNGMILAYSLAHFKKLFNLYRAGETEMSMHIALVPCTLLFQQTGNGLDWTITSGRDGRDHNINISGTMEIIKGDQDASMHYYKESCTHELFHEDNEDLMEEIVKEVADRYVKEHPEFAQEHGLISK